MNAKRKAKYLRATSRKSDARALRITFQAGGRPGPQLEWVADWLKSIPHKGEFGVLLDAQGPKLALYVVSESDAILHSFNIKAKQVLPQIHCEPAAYPDLRALIEEPLAFAVLQPARRALHPFRENLSKGQGHARESRGDAVRRTWGEPWERCNLMTDLLHDFAQTPHDTRRILYLSLRADRRRIMDGPKYKPPKEETEDKTDYSKMGFIEHLAMAFGSMFRMFFGLMQNQGRDEAAYQAKGTASKLFWCGAVYLESGYIFGHQMRQAALEQLFHILKHDEGNRYRIKPLDLNRRRAAVYLTRLVLGKSIRYRSLSRRHLNWSGEAAELIMPPTDPCLAPSQLWRKNPALPPSAAETARSQALQAKQFAALQRRFFGGK